MLCDCYTNGNTRAYRRWKRTEQLSHVEYEVSRLNSEHASCVCFASIWPSATWFPPPRRHGSGCVCVVCGVCACVCGGTRVSSVPQLPEPPKAPPSLPESPGRPVTPRRPPPAGGDQASAVPLAGHHLLHLGADGLQVQGHPRARPADRCEGRLVGERERLVGERDILVGESRLVGERGRLVATG